MLWGFWSTEISTYMECHRPYGNLVIQHQLLCMGFWWNWIDIKFIYAAKWVWWTNWCVLQTSVISYSKASCELKFHCRFDPEIYKICHKAHRSCFTQRLPNASCMPLHPSLWLDTGANFSPRLCLNRSPQQAISRNPRLLNQKSKGTSTRRLFTFPLRLIARRHLATPPHCFHQNNVKKWQNIISFPVLRVADT